MSENKKISEFDPKEIFTDEDFVGGYQGPDPGPDDNRRYGRAAFQHAVLPIVEQRLWVNNVNGDDADAKINNSDKPWATIKAAAGAITGRSAVIIIQEGTGLYDEDPDILENLAAGVEHLYIISAATTIRAEKVWWLLGHENIQDFRFYGPGTNLVGVTNTGIVLANNARLNSSSVVCNNLTTENVNSYCYTIDDKAHHNLVVYGDILGAISLRGGYKSETTVHGNIVNAGTSQFSACIDVQNLTGIHHVKVFGELINSDQADFRASVVRVSGTQTAGRMILDGNISSTRVAHVFGLLHWDGAARLGEFHYKGTVTAANNTGPLIRIQNSNAAAMKMVIAADVDFNNANGQLLQLPNGTSGNIDFTFCGSFSTFAVVAISLTDRIKITFQDTRFKFTSGPGTVFSAPDNQTLSPEDFPITFNNVEIDSTSELCVFQPATVTTGNYEVRCLGIVRCNTETVIPDYAELVYLPDITVQMPQVANTLQGVLEEGNNTGGNDMRFNFDDTLEFMRDGGVNSGDRLIEITGSGFPVARAKLRLNDTVPGGSSINPNSFTLFRAGEGQMQNELQASLSIGAVNRLTGLDRKGRVLYTETFCPNDDEDSRSQLRYRAAGLTGSDGQQLTLRFPKLNPNATFGPANDRILFLPFENGTLVTIETINAANYISEPQVTSFPASPANFQRVFRTDLGEAYYYDQSVGNWLSQNVYTYVFGSASNSFSGGPLTAANGPAGIVTSRRIMITELDYSNLEPNLRTAILSLKSVSGAHWEGEVTLDPSGVTTGLSVVIVDNDLLRTEMSGIRNDADEAATLSRPFVKLFYRRIG